MNKAILLAGLLAWLDHNVTAAPLPDPGPGSGLVVVGQDDGRVV